MIQLNLFAKQKKKRDADTEDKRLDTKGDGVWDGLGGWGWHVYTTVYAADGCEGLL